MGSLAQSVVGHGADGLIVNVECHLSNNLPVMVIVGFAGRAVNEARDRLRGAFASSNLVMPRRRITVNLAPADIPKADSGLDLAIAASILCADQQITRSVAGLLIIGELSLNGQVQPVRGIIGKLLAGRQRGLRTCFVPRANLHQAQLVPGLTIYPVATLSELYSHLSDQLHISPINTGDGLYIPPPQTKSEHLLLDEIVGQEKAKRALLIAAAGGHNLLLSGPPGVGKSMLAHALAELLPPMNQEEILAVTQLHSLASRDYEHLVVSRPVRTPHHSASLTALIGGGQQLRPGEISLSHRGVLLLDEFPEFSRDALEALRQPLEDRMIAVSRSKLSLQLPADFMLVATANPCPCGFYGSQTQDCRCQGRDIQRYQAKLSGPIIDRIDLCCDVHGVDHTRLLSGATHSAQDYPRAITVARQRQAARDSAGLNSTLDGPLLRRCALLSRAAASLLNEQATALQLSARSYVRTVRVARTIADLADSPSVEVVHVGEALSFRRRPVQAAV